MKFVMPRDITIPSIFGHSVEFKKGVPTHVPPKLWPEAMAADGVAEDTELVLEAEKEQTAAERLKQIFMAYEEIMKRGEPNDLAKGGEPHARVVSGLVGFSVSVAERDSSWAAFQKKFGESK